VRCRALGHGGSTYRRIVGSSGIQFVVGHGTGHTAGRITNTVPVTCNTIPVHILHLQVRAKHTVFFFTPYYGYHGILLTP
jgi:hypothetical protein